MSSQLDLKHSNNQIEMLFLSFFWKAPVLDISDVLRHPQNQTRKLLKSAENEFNLPEVAPRLSRTPGCFEEMATCPQVGEHTIEILRDYCNYSQDQIQQILKDRVAGANKSKL